VDSTTSVPKIKVETVGDFMLQDPATLEVVEAFGVSEVSKTQFIESAIESGRLKEAGGDAAEKPDTAPTDGSEQAVSDEPRRVESDVPNSLNTRSKKN